MKRAVIILACEGIYGGLHGMNSTYVYETENTPDFINEANSIGNEMGWECVED